MNSEMAGQQEAPEETLGGRIQLLRAAHGLSRVQLARRVGVVSDTLRNWELDRSEPRANKLQILAGALKVPPLWLLSGSRADAEVDFEVRLNETAQLTERVERLLELHQESAKLIFELDAEIRRLQSEIDDGAS